ncbi:MAG: hypothetical protein JO257_12260 [Deltaproteobacteria bacterium]|nr:hypothetical protein [Deltaproteobacteria bacterium]
MTRAALCLLAGCSFSAHGMGGPGSNGGGGGGLVDDSAADFMASDPASDAVIDPLGILEPRAYSRGGLRARAYDGKHVTGATTAWADIETEVAAAPLRAIAYEQLPTNWGNAHPTGLALTSDDNFTVIYEGELHVTAGDHTVDIDADDAGALAIGGQFVVDATGGAKSLTVHADADSWIPIQLAIGEGMGNSQLIARLDGTAITGDQTRAPTTHDHGLMLRVYYGTTTSETQVGALLAEPNVNWGMLAPPYDLPGVPTSYRAHFSGQLRIDADAMYTIATTTGNADDATELYIDGHLVARTNGYPDPHPTSATLALTAGWHGIVVELGGSQKNLLGGADAHDVTLATTIATEGGALMKLGPERLRPAMTSGYREIAFTAQTYLNDKIIDPGVTMVPVPVTLPVPPAGAVIDNATYGYFYTHATPSDYAVTLAMGSASIPLPSTAAYDLAFGDESTAGQPVPTTAGTWSFTFTDSVSGNATGQADQSVLGVVVFNAHGGPLMPFAPSWLYVSSPRQVNAKEWGPLMVSANLAGATMTISARSAASADALGAAPWVDVANGGVPAIMPNAYVQYRLAVTGDGWQYPSIDRVSLDYTTADD